MKKIYSFLLVLLMAVMGVNTGARHQNVHMPSHSAKSWRT